MKIKKTKNKTKTKPHVNPQTKEINQRWEVLEDVTTTKTRIAPPPPLPAFLSFFLSSSSFFLSFLILSFIDMIWPPLPFARNFSFIRVGVYAETAIHHYSISLAHSFTRCCFFGMIFWHVHLALYSPPPPRLVAVYTFLSVSFITFKHMGAWTDFQILWTTVGRRQSFCKYLYTFLLLI